MVVIAMTSLVLISLQQVMGQSLATHTQTREKMDHVVQARFTMDRLAMLVTEAGAISSPAAGAVGESLLVIEERLMDLDGDGFPDADNDANGAVNDDDTDDPIDWITISMDITDPDNKKLVEVLPDYTTNPSGDMTPRILCENVETFALSRGSSNAANLITIELTLGTDTNRITLKTRAIAAKVILL